MGSFAPFTCILVETWWGSITREPGAADRGEETAESESEKHNMTSLGIDRSPSHCSERHFVWTVIPHLDRYRSDGLANAS